MNTGKLVLCVIIAVGAMFTVQPFFKGVVAQSAEGDRPPAEAEPFWKYITEENPYTKWELWPGHEGMYPGQSPHGAFLKLYANDIAIQAAREGKPMPDGAILVKENYGEDKQQLAAITPMYKVAGYNPDAGDWFWAKYGPDGSVDAAGKVEGCIECHKKADDFRFTKAE